MRDEIPLVPLLGCPAGPYLATDLGVVHLKEKG